jgi:hypothetical protein
LRLIPATWNNHEATLFCIDDCPSRKPAQNQASFRDAEIFALSTDDGRFGEGGCGFRETPRAIRERFRQGHLAEGTNPLRFAGKN